MARPRSAGTLADKLAAGRRRRFVGRAAEIELFRRAVASGASSCAVLFVHGPGGIGKTSLLDVYREVAAAAGVPTAYLDARDVPPVPDAVAQAVEHLPHHGPAVLLVDSYERLEPLDGWIRTRLLPGMSGDAVTVLAGRHPPPAAWRADPAWRGLVKEVPLRNLTPDDSHVYLRECGLDEALRERVVRLTHGHPLGLALVAEVAARDGGVPLDGMPPDVVRGLVQRFVDTVPGAVHRRALEVAALARATTEPLLRDALGIPDAAEIFAWLRGLSFMDSGPDGVFPHDLARDALAADLHWRDSESYQRLFRGIRTHIIERLKATSGREQQRALFDAKFMHRYQPVSRAWADWDSFGKHYAEPARPADLPAILDLVGRWEGPESADLAHRWWGRQPGGFHVVRDAVGGVRGCLAIIELTRAAAADLAADPVAAAALDHAQRHRPLRPGALITQTRFLVDRDRYQRPSPTLNLGPVLSIQHYLTTPRLAVDYLVFADPEAWTEYFAFFEIARAVGADGIVGGRAYGQFARDFRQIPLDEWLPLMFERDLTGERAAPPAPAEPPVLALSQPDFADAVRRALRDLRRPDRLAENPLARSRLVHADRSNRAPAATLAGVVTDAVAALADDPRERRYFHALDRTYVRPAGSQERAAEVLDLPLSTYKRHLKQGVETVVARLWRRELGAG